MITETYIEFRGKDNKTYNGGLRHRYIAPKSVRQYLEKDCQTLKSYQMYMNAIYEIDKSVSSPFYRRPVLSDGSVKFDHILGANRLGSLMKTICQKGELKGNFSNHSGKRTLATRLYQAGVSEQMIMDRTGHRSEKAVRTYKRPADSMLKDVSNILNPSNKQIKLEDPKPLTDTRAILPEQVDIENTENAFNVSKPEGKYRGLPSNSSFQNCVFNFAHSCVEKAGMIGLVKMRQLDVDEHFSLRGHVLERAIEVCATLGTTACCSFDHLQELSEVCAKESVWLHVDAAYAGNALICAENQHYIRGIEASTLF
ncbi:TDC-1 [Mytilus edulis]|uniref:TDC-1 n=1 Tax=Mytilus edulis TaxID=6550 RepID=A0A8S3PWM0_MYTED|nr:TDC-1 [Mytilus edulis]